MTAQLPKVVITMTASIDCQVTPACLVRTRYRVLNESGPKSRSR